MQLIKQTKCQEGYIRRYRHESSVTKCTMHFSVFLPPNANDSHKVPVLYYLPGLSCNDEILFMKAPNALETAADRGIAIVCCDTSPRGVEIEGENDFWDFGSGAGFYVDATEQSWKEHYLMYSYVTQELPLIVKTHLPILDKQSIMGHSMGGHGALVIGIRNNDQYASISALCPIAHPSKCPWGIKAFTGYLGCDQQQWKTYDATYLILKEGPINKEILISQGTEDTFLHEKQLLPEAFQAACDQVNQSLELQLCDDYDHSYFFVSTFIKRHVNFHANALLA